MRKFFSCRWRWNGGVCDFLPGNFNLENEGLRCCWWGEVKLIQNSSFLFHSHYSPGFPEKKVAKNTFRAFTGKLEKPINLRCRGGDASSEGWMILTSLENEQSESYGYAISLQMIFFGGCGGETYPVVLGKLWRKIRFCFCCWQKRFMSCFVCETWWGRMIAQSVCLQKDLQKVCIYLFFFLFFFFPLPPLLFQPLMSALSLGWNRIPLSSAAPLSAGFSGTMTSILPDISGEIRIFLKEDISHKSGCRVISLSRSNTVSFRFGCAGTKVAILEMGWRMANLF